MKFHFSHNLNLEKRQLNTIPTLNIKKLNQFATDYEKYFNDNFGFRSYLTHLYHLVQVNIFKTSPTPQVTIGKDQWLFYKSEAASDGSSINDYEGKVQFTSQQLSKIISNLSAIEKTLSDQHILFLLLISPSKHTIYDEYLPSSIKQKKGTTKYDQLEQALINNPNIKLIKSKSVLLQNKYKNILYYKTDTHWNNMGAFIIYQELMKNITTTHPSIKPYTTADYMISKETTNGNGDLSTMLSLPGKFKDFTFTFEQKNPTTFSKTNVSSLTNKDITIEIPNSDAPKLLVFRDSFFTDLLPFISQHFSKSIYLWTLSFNYEIVKEEKPDIVIWEISERYLDALLQ